MPDFRRTRVVQPRRQVLNPDQMPLIVPESSWICPAELPDLTRVKEFALDTEELDQGLINERGPGWVYGAGHVAGVSVAWREAKALRSCYVPVNHPDTPECFDKDSVRRWLEDITRNARVIFQNAPYDIGWLNQDFGLKPPKKIDDVGCMAVMIDETHFRYDLDAIAERLGIPGKDTRLLEEAARIYGYANSKEAIARMPARMSGTYAEQDAVTTLLSAEAQRPELAAQGLLSAYKIEMDLIPLVHAMRRQGIRMDEDAIDRSMAALYARRDRALAELTRLLGGRAIDMKDIRSQKWLINSFSNAGVEYDYDEQEKKASFERDWMRQGYLGRYEEGRRGHWLPKLIAEAKQCHDSADKFFNAFLKTFLHRGRIHASINQFLNEGGGTRTHRFSYSDPPLQQMPSRPEMFLIEWTLTGEIAKMIRECFLPERGEKWFSPDYSQQEYRLIVHFANRLGLIKGPEAAEMYNRDPDTDFHNLVVLMTGLTRRRAKDCNFAKSYGAGLPKFAAMTGMAIEDAKEAIEKYDTEMPFVRQLNERCDKAAQKQGYILMIDGARMHFNKWECSAWIDWDVKREANYRGYKTNECSREEALDRCRTSGHPWFGKGLKRALTRKAMNGKIQGSAARQMKRAMRDVWDAGYTPLLQMHDELPCSIAEEKDGRRIAEIMRSAFPDATVPFRVDEEYGVNWADAKHEWKKVRRAA